jgi:hypothetical protein
MDETKVVRIRISTEKLLKAFNTPSIDESIRKMWNKLCLQGKTLNQWKKESGCANSEELRRLLDKLLIENNGLREQLKLKER